MLVDYDAEKDAANVGKHGVSLSFGARLFDDPDHVIAASFRPVDGEDRYKVVGVVDARLWTAIYVGAETRSA